MCKRQMGKVEDLEPVNRYAEYVKTRLPADKCLHTYAHSSSAYLLCREYALDALCWKTGATNALRPRYGLRL